jgi:beta-glucanase (GH16 family)
MGCNCGQKNQVTRTTYTWTSADGKTTKTNLTELEARAAKIRQGGSYRPS